MIFDSIADLFDYIKHGRYSYDTEACDGKKRKIGETNKAGTMIKYREGYGTQNWRPISSTKERPIKNVIVTKTQEVTKKDASGKIIDANWIIEKDTEIEHCATIASGNGIKNVKRLLREYPGTTEQDWQKQKGEALIKPKIAKKQKVKQLLKKRQAEVHWYYSKKTGIVEMKRVKWLN